MAMTVYNPFTIELIFRMNFKFTISSFSMYSISTELYKPLDLTDAIRYYGNPVAFKLLNLNINSDSPKLINWLQTDFKYIFDHDPLLWFASVGTMPIELRQYLIPFYQESKEPQCHINGLFNN